MRCTLGAAIAAAVLVVGGASAGTSRTTLGLRPVLTGLTSPLFMAKTCFCSRRGSCPG